MSKRFRLGDGTFLHAVENVSLDLESGRRTALVGPSGSGKSTLLHLIGLIEEPDSGAITVDGVVVTDLSRRRAADYRSGVGFVFQQFHLLPALTLLDNVIAPLMGRPFQGDRRAHARDLLGSVGLGDRTDARPGELSGGQQQRVAIARALVASPSLLLADEPTGNLDSETAREVMHVLVSLQEACGATLVVATHDPSIAGLCHDVVEMLDGRASVRAVAGHA
ncbi:MAG TPA: ABC transporter ATP-binding protein [Propionibacteriaceae bacterium]|nr:ABC transporter ATP-binding protein [Propionibacteriaceae bacterium]